MQNSLVTAHSFTSPYAVAKWTLWTWKSWVMSFVNSCTGL